MEQSTETFRLARVSEYVDWLRGHLAGGGQITHAYDYPIARADFLLARSDFTTGGECGTDAAQIVVPAGVRHLGGDLGHNNLFFMDGFTCTGRAIVPVYADPEFDALPGVREARDLAKAERVGFERRMRQRQEESATRARTSDLSAYRILAADR